MDKTFLHSKPHLSQFTSFLMNHFFQSSVWRKQIKLEEEVAHQEIHLSFSPLQLPFMLPLTLLVCRYSLYCSYMGSISLLFVLHLVLFLFTYLFCISYGTRYAHVIIWYLRAAGKDWKQLELWERWYLLRIICQPFLFLGISNTQSDYYFFF